MKVNESLPHPVSFPNQSVVLCASTLPLDESEGSDVKESTAIAVPRNFIDHPQPTDIPPQDTCEDTQ